MAKTKITKAKSKKRLTKPLSETAKKLTLSQQNRQVRLKEIYSYFRQQLNKERSKSPYFTSRLDLEPTLAKELAKQQKQYPEYDFYAEFRKNKKHLVYRLNKLGQAHLFRQTTKAYQEELAEQANQVRYWQEKAGLTKINPKTLLKRGQQIKLFWPEQGEHREFFKRNKEFKQLWTEISASKGSIKRELNSNLSKQLYQKSPWRIRDYWLQAPKQVGDYLTFEGGEGKTVIHTQKVQKRDWNLKDVFYKYYKNNSSPHTRKHYRQAISELLRKPQLGGELVSESEIELNRYGHPKLKVRQTLSLSINKPGRKWTLVKNIPQWQEIEKKQIHEVAHQGYLEEYGTELEIRTWKLKKDKALCWVEAMGLGSCAANVGTSNWWCLECVYYGEYHPPVLPRHCMWEYTYRKDICAGSQKHSDANKQWHFSIEGEKKRDFVKGGDWGSCHIGTFGQTKAQKNFQKRYRKRR